MSYKRDEELIKLRPEIETENKGTQSDFEAFQNNTLRQICKFQNELVLDFVNEYIKAKNKNFDKHALNDKLNYINSLFAKDTSFKNKLRGLIIGHFTIEEFQFYAKNVSEIDKRIVQLLKTRFLSQVEY